MPGGANGRKIDPEFRQILLELTMEYMSQNPPDFLDFALDFLYTKRIERISAVKAYEVPPENLVHDGEKYIGKRASFRVESFDPGQEEFISPKIYPKSDVQKAKLMKVLDKIVIFVSVLEADRKYIIDVMQRKVVTKGEVIITQGKFGDYFYIVDSGKFEAFKKVGGKKEVLKTYDNEGYFGELALLHNAPRASTVRALSEGVLWAIDRSTFRNVVLRAEFRRTKLYEEFLEKVPLLYGLTPKERQTLADSLIPRVYKPGQRLISEGEVGDGMYFIVSGTARVAVSDAARGEEVEIKSLNPGDYFGELALITHKPRAASVYAVTHVQAAFLEMASFERLLGPCIDLMERNVQQYDQELKGILTGDCN